MSAAEHAAAAQAAPPEHVVYVMVTLRVADPAATTALHALQHRLGYAERITGLRRWQLWRFEVRSPERHAAESLVLSWVTRAEQFVNPNQHTFYVVDEDTPWDLDEGGTKVWVAVANEPDLAGESASRVVRDRLHGSQLDAARFAVVWELELAPSVALDAAERLVDEAAVTRARGTGLLVNPHYQRAHVSARRSARRTGAALWTGA